METWIFGFEWQNTSSRNIELDLIIKKYTLIVMLILAEI